MAETKRPCAQCENVMACDMIARCVKHDPVPPTFDNYLRLGAPSGMAVEPCPVCASDPEVWQYIDKPGAVAQKVVMCSHDEAIGPHDPIAGGCPLYMPPNDFYNPTIREAVRHWNEFAKALISLREHNSQRCQSQKGKE